MKVEIEQSFDAPLEVVLRAKDERYDHLDKIEGLKKLVFSKEEEDDKTITTHRPFDISMDRTPAPIRKMLPAGLFDFVEIAVWDKEKNRVEWEMVSKAKKKLSWKGVTSYAANGDSTTRKIKCQIKVKVAFIGGEIEKTMASGFKKGMEKDYKFIAKMIELIENE